MDTKRIVAPLLVVACAGCISGGGAPSLWPPSDFSLSVSAQHRSADGQSVLYQRFFVDYDGLAIYREADDQVADGLPVFDVVSEYQLDPQSLRWLSRLASRAGLFRSDSAFESNATPVDSHVELRWTGFDSAGRLSSEIDSGGVLDRMIHVVNAFLPEGRSFGFSGMTGDEEPRSVSRVPEPLEWVDGSLRRHRWYVGRFDDDADFAIDTLAIACRAEDREVAEAMLRLVEKRAPTAGVGPLGEGGEDWKDRIDAYRRAVDAVPR
ncbi:MAG: hypothetical protein KDB80_18125 [Planctomycetes bacterium]|nr:hypothetical protein [Planctomycetota bacterium]